MTETQVVRHLEANIEKAQTFHCVAHEGGTAFNIAVYTGYQRFCVVGMTLVEGKLGIDSYLQRVASRTAYPETGFNKARYEEGFESVASRRSVIGGVSFLALCSEGS